MLKKIFKKIKYSLKLSFKFSFKVGVLEFFSIFLRIKNKSGQKLELKKERIVCKKLKAKFSLFIDDLNKNIKLNDEVIIPKNVFVLWYQGIDNAPLIVIKCIESIKNVYSDYNINIVDKNNVNEFAVFPDYIYKLVDEGIISLTHFSDLIRLNILKNIGGIWIDATCFCSSVPNLINLSFFTLKHGQGSNWNISNGKWSAFYLASSKNNYLISWVYDFCIEYWKDYKIMPCYFLIDCAFYLAYTSNSINSRIIDFVPPNNKRVFDLESMLNDKIDVEKLNQLFLETNVSKLTYKKKFDEKNDTVYSALLSGNLV